ncbi:serpin family protein [Streptomyces sp. ISL-36]|uniref:serpin family protein n=1 Tax=Streptomyces sp. ISL-36 TaxID=2819182 RepID=UPI0027E57745|nr:serpin family protein [Streptomyces sp. ISL-36]
MNGLTARWAGTLAGEGGVLSATGVWPLLAFLADGAAGPARTELEDALGMRAAEAAEGARGLLGALGAMRGSASAIGLWAGPDLALHERWVTGLPEATLGRFTGDAQKDGQILDAWASERTGGLVPVMPVVVDAGTKLVLAAAQAVRTRWLQPFVESDMAPEYGPWAGRCLAGLRRGTSLLDRVGVARTAAGPLTVLKVLGDTGVDVHLLLGEEETPPGAVLRGGLDALAGGCPTVPGDLLPLGEPGPGLNVRNMRSSHREPTLSVTTSPFSLTADHDLLANAGLFGLTAAMDDGYGHFPGVSGFPLAIASARQTALARFDATGFEAASVTAMEAVAGGIPDLPYVTRSIDLDFDRPFGFLTVHRTSRLVLTAGWVAEPVEYVFEDDDAA